jgi:hypothetical protein
MRLTFFKRNTPRGVNYKPRYYVPVKEEREQRRRELLGPDAGAPGGGEYIPGDVIRARGIKRNRPGISSRAVERKRTSTMRAVVALGILVLLLIWWFTSK